LGSESGQAHRILLLIAKRFLVDVIVADKHKSSIDDFDYGEGVTFHFIPTNETLVKLYSRLGLYNFSYVRFIHKATPWIMEHGDKSGYKFVHFLTPNGMHSFNTLYRTMKLPYVVGPLGGGLKTPRSFNKAFDFNARLRDMLRSSFYYLLNKISFWRQYILHARKIIIGTDYIAKYLQCLPREYHQEIANKLRIIFDATIETKDYPEKPRTNFKNHVQVVFVGNLIAIKGIFLLIDAIREIQARRSDVLAKTRVVVLGGGPLHRKAQKRVAEYGLAETVRLVGRVSLQEVKAHLHESDIFCLPTIRDHGGTAILEAMATGLPIITSDYGGPKFSVNEECGIKIAVASYDQYVCDLAQAIITLATNERLRAEMGARARQRVVAEFSVEAFQRKLFAVYDEVIAEASRWSAG
jgi:glycosyltransferase involved in cell wall biosynthesis